jgi:signal transduction histidine kinase
VTGARRATAVAWLSITAASLAGAVLTIMAWGDLATRDAVTGLSFAPSPVFYATLGALIVRRAGNVIGWLLLGIGAGVAIMWLASAYAVLGISRPGTLPAPELAGLLAEWSFVPVFTGVPFMLVLFPSGTLPSPRWRPWLGLGLVATALTMIGFVVRPRAVALPAPGGVSLTIENPLGIRSLGPVLSTVLIGTLNGLAVLGIALLAAAFVSLAGRFRSGGREVRQQIKWIALAVAVVTACQLVALLALAATGDASNPVTVTAYVVIPVITLFGVPAVITLAILKHGLYQIDVILNRAVQYGLLSAALTAVYAGIVIGIGTLAGYSGGPALTVAAAVAVALLFQPVRQRARLVANHVVYGERATPYQVLADFAQDMAGQLDLDLALDRMASLLAAATGAVRVEVWIRVGAELRPQVTWPRGAARPAAVPLAADPDLPVFEQATRAIAVRHRDELLGALTVQKPRNEPVSAAEDKLLTHLASQAGLVLRNVGLTAELQATIDDLRASRRRLVRAQDEERQRIERNLHDGAQQQLVALMVQVSLLEDARDADEVRQLTGQLRSGLRGAIDDLRALARGIYPPLLADQGLGPALRAQAGRAPLPVLVEADGVGRYPRDAEAAVYFCVLEALQNVTKYARASRATIALTCPDGHLAFAVADDGDGFDTAQASCGTGLPGMADRLAAVGGTLLVTSAPGLGTTVSGTLPVSAPAESRH